MALTIERKTTEDKTMPGTRQKAEPGVEVRALRVHLAGSANIGVGGLYAVTEREAKELEARGLVERTKKAPAAKPEPAEDKKPEKEKWLGGRLSPKEYVARFGEKGEHYALAQRLIAADEAEAEE